MFKFLRYFKDDRKKVIIIIACVSVIICAVIMYFNYLKEENKYSNNNSSSSNNTTAIIKNDTNIANNNIDNIIKTNSTSDAIEKFVNFCNKKDTDSAYNMLTNDCKEVLYGNNKDSFINEYVNKIFDKQRSYKIIKKESSNDVYEVIFSENPIGIGDIDKVNNKSDYITVINESGTYKLGVAGFIKKENLSASNKNNYMQIKVLSRYIFTDYEIYNFSARNDILVDFVLDNMENNIKTYIEDNDGNRFKIANDEYTSETTRVQNGKEVNISLKFDRKYSNNNKQIKKIVFSRINVLNRNYYQKVFNPEDNTTSYQEKMSTYPVVLSFELEL